MRNKIITAVVVALMTTLALAGCKVGSSAAGASSDASALATNTSATYAKDQAAKVLDKCMPAQNELTQLEWLKNIVSPKKGERARHTFETCAGVSPGNDAKFKTQVENQGLAVLQVYAHDEASGNKVAAKAAVKDYTENQVEKDAVADR